MSKKTVIGMLLALIALPAMIAPALAQYYGNPYHQPYYNGYGYRGYTPPEAYGYCPGRYRRDHTVRNVAIGAGIGAAVGLLASHHGHRYYD